MYNSLYIFAMFLDQRHSPGFIESLTKAQDPRLEISNLNRETEV